MSARVNEQSKQLLFVFLLHVSKTSVYKGFTRWSSKAFVAAKEVLYIIIHPEHNFLLEFSAIWEISN